VGVGRREENNHAIKKENMVHLLRTNKFQSCIENA